MNNDFESYKMYLAIKRHFNSKTYNYLKYNGKSKTSLKAFEKRNDKFIFSKLTKHKDKELYLISNFINNNENWIGDIVNSDKSEKIYLNFLKNQESVTYIFKNDIKKLKTDLKENFKVVDNQLPYVLKLYLHDEIQFHTLIILIEYFPIWEYWDKKIIDPIYLKLKMKIQKGKYFINFDKNKMKNLLKQEFKYDK